MTPEKQRIAIAKACGWKPEKTWHLGPDEFWGEHPEPPHTYQKLPDYINDLNAMHDAEDTMRGDGTLWDDYSDHLCSVMGGVGYSWHATACDRAEAFLRTLNLWTEN